jgi:hypothetical protein
MTKCGLGHDVTTVSAAFTGGGGSGALAAVRLNPHGGRVVGVDVTAAGSGYTSAPTLTITSAAGSDAMGVAVMRADTTKSSPGDSN